MIEQNQLDEFCNLLSKSLEVITNKMEKICEELSKTLEELFEEIEFDEIYVLSEKEIKKKIKYAKTPMEAKHWNKMLNEKKRRKRNEEN